MSFSGRASEIEQDRTAAFSDGEPANGRTLARRRRRRALKWMVGILGGLLLLSMTLLLAKDSILKKMAEARIRQETGMQAEIGQLHVALWKAAIEVRDFKILPPSEFGDRPLLSMPALFLEMDSEQARLGKFRFKTVRLNVEEVNVVRGKDGAYNIKSLNRSATRSTTASSSPAKTDNPSRDLEFAGIERLELSVDKIRYTDLKRPKRSREIDLGLRDETVTGLNSEDEIKAWAAGFLLQILMREYLLK